MTNLFRLLAIITVLFLGDPVPALAAPAAPDGQASVPRDRVVVDELVLRDGSRLYGSVERETESELVVRTWAGVEMTVPRADVVSLRKVDGSIGQGEFWRADPNRTRLFFAPTGRSLPKGEVTLGVYEFLMPFVQVGVTDRFSIGGGTPLVFGAGQGWDRPFWLTPKLPVYSGGRTQVAVGTLHFFGMGGDGGGIAYAAGTFDLREGSLTVGVGRTYTGFDGGGGVLMIGGEAQVMRNIKLVTENYAWGGGGITSGGIRFFGERLSADLGLAFPIGADGFFAFPVVNFVYVW